MLPQMKRAAKLHFLTREALQIKKLLARYVMPPRSNLVPPLSRPSLASDQRAKTSVYCCATSVLQGGAVLKEMQELEKERMRQLQAVLQRAAP